MNDPKAVKISIVRCDGYEPDRVQAAVRRAVDLAGGISDLLKPGSKVLLKPNLLSARLPEEGVDTHPEVVRAVAGIIKDWGCQGSVGDSPGGYGDNIEEIWERSGMKEMALKEGLELVKFSSSKNIDGFPISRHVLDADFVISIPKLKTHSITTLTAGVKNMFGAVPGLFKASCHSRAPNEESFAPLLAKIYSIVRPGFTVLDAVVSMEGDGPASGDLKRTGFIMASRDAVAIDAVLAKMVGLEPFDLAVTKLCHELGLGVADLSMIELIGDDVNSFGMSDFKLPQTKIFKILPRAVLAGAASFIRFKPVIDAGACKRCNLCKLSCPVNAINIEEEACDIDYKKCVRCLCCQEICPYRAIYIKRSILAKMIWG